MFLAPSSVYSHNYIHLYIFILFLYQYFILVYLKVYHILNGSMTRNSPPPPYPCEKRGRRMSPCNTFHCSDSHCIDCKSGRGLGTARAESEVDNWSNHGSHQWRQISLDIYSYRYLLDNYWLVVWNMKFIFHILGIVTPTDFHIFQRGRSTTNQITRYLWKLLDIYSQILAR